jgi:hypothetical protein
MQDPGTTVPLADCLDLDLPVNQFRGMYLDTSTLASTNRHKREATS